ncbi:MAG: diguanylate cyclase [Undibacterium sp.]|uniref:diguanylate cyclase domain-containing protein n=1 Tax=Undibacterium sp. TaxID=1914977 RepID=UPI0027219CAC|nr:diguanylate cyclase [Undibacterium sp.]MDO8654558.1 diguanylate cyclase [Undibacterium sp.]
MPPISSPPDGESTSSGGSPLPVARVLASSDRFLQRFVDGWILFAIALWLFLRFTLPGVAQYPGGLMLAAGLSARWALYTGRLRWARYLIVLPASAAVMLMPLFLHGVQTPVLAILPLIVVLAGWMLGRHVMRWLVGFFVFCVALYWLADTPAGFVLSLPLRAPDAWAMAWLLSIVLTGIVAWSLLGNYASNFAQEQATQRQLADALKIASTAQHDLAAVVTLNEAILHDALAETQRLRNALETVPFRVSIKDKSGRYTYANKKVCDFLGYPLDEVVTHTDEKFFDLLVADNLSQNDRRVLDQGECIEAEETHVIAASGETHYYWSVKSPIIEDGNIIGICAISSDITERRRIEDELRHARLAAESAHGELTAMLKLNQSLLRDSAMPMGVFDDSGDCVEANEAYAELIGSTREKLIGVNFYEDYMWQASGLVDDCLRTLRHKTAQRREVSVVTGSGNDLWLDTRILPVEMHGENHFLVEFIDLTERKRFEHELRQLAFNDPLTELPGRRLLLDRLTQTLYCSKRQNSHGALLFLDLNKFTQLNDRHGHAVGDQLLIEVANRLRQAVRQTDTVARLAGDEFVVLLEDLGTEAEFAAEYVKNVVDKMRLALSEEYLLGQIRHRGSVSICVSMFLGDHRDPDQILRQADMAMVETKRKRALIGSMMGRE